MRSLEKDVTINIQHGIHGRVATSLAQIAGQHEVHMFILHDDREVDCSSVLDVLSMAFVKGTRLRFRIRGESASQAMKAVEKLFAEREEP